MVDFGSWFKGTVHHGRKVADWIAFAVRKQREMELLFSYFSPFSLVEDPHVMR